MERITRAEVMRAAKEFGEALLASKEMQILQQAERDFRQNREITDLLSSYQTRQRFLQFAQMNEAEVTEEERAELKDLEAKVNSNALIKNFIESNQAFEEAMRNLNTEISDLLGIDFSVNSSTGGCC